MAKEIFLDLKSTLVSFLILLLCSCEDTNQVEIKKSKLCNPQIMAYHFGVEDSPIPQQISTLANLKMDGMILQIETGNLQTLDAYYETESVRNGTFQIYDVFTSIFLDDPTARESQMATIEAIYKKIQFKKTVLQVLFHGKQDNENATSFIARIADVAKNYNKELIIYPHEGLAIETAEQALNYIKATKKNNVFLALHLCHELAAGNGGRIDEVVKNVAPYIRSASVSGATESEQLNQNLPLWFWAIKPLHMGTYDLKKYYKALYNYGYEGPVAIHTWGIFKNFGLVLKDHLPTSREVLLQLATDACQ